MRQPPALIVSAVASMILAACAAPRLGPTPPGTPSPSPFVVAATVRPSTTPVPSDPCAVSAIDEPIEAVSVRFAGSPMLIDLELTGFDHRPADAQWELGTVPTVPSPIESGDASALIGGEPLTATFEVASHAPGPSRITSVSIRLAQGGGPLVAVPTDVSSAAFRMTLPDTTELAVLEIAVRWSDACFTYEARALRQLRLVEKAVGAGCPVGQDAWNLYDRTVHDHGLVTTEGSMVAFFPTETIGRFTSYAVSVDGPILSAWQANWPPVLGSPGSTLRLRPGMPGLELSDPTVSFFRRADVLADPVGDSITPVVTRHAIQSADGQIAIRLPESAGDYAMELSGSYSLPCSVGSGFALMSLAVR